VKIRSSPLSIPVCGLSLALVAGLLAGSARADEVWVAPTYQADLGGVGIGSNVIWPATVVGAVRFAWAVPDNLETFQSAKVVLIPHSPGGASTLNVHICRAENAGAATAACVGPFAEAFTGVPNELLEVDISALLGPGVGAPGLRYLAVLAFTTPTTATDHVVGLRFVYTPTAVAPGANTVGSSEVINDSLTANDLAPNSVTASELAANSVGESEVAFNYAGSASEGGAATDLSCAACVSASEVAFDFADQGANTFTGTQTITTGNLDLDDSTGATTGNIKKSGTRFLHNFGTDTVFLGLAAGNFSMTGARNVGLGPSALASNTTGFDNAAGGESALTNNTTGRDNTAFGSGALDSNTTGISNTAVGSFALPTLTTGGSNVAIGERAGLFLQTGSENIYIGAGSTGNGTESNTIRLGGAFQTKVFITGIRGITTANNNAIPVLIDSSGQLGTVSSSRRYKEDIHDMADASRRVLQLRPVTFRYTQAYGDGSKPQQFGLIAEEVVEVFPELAVRDANGQIDTVHYETLNVLLLNELQKQQRELRQARVENEQERRENHRQQERIEALEQRLNQLLGAPTDHH
jgi:Chaperone of endosialidase